MSGNGNGKGSDPIVEKLKAAHRAHNLKPIQDEQGQPFPYQALHVHLHDLTFVFPEGCFKFDPGTQQITVEQPPAVLGPQGDKEVRFLRDQEGRLQAAIVRQDEPKND
jgi:hypothetical protein